MHVLHQLHEKLGYNSNWLLQITTVQITLFLFLARGNKFSIGLTSVENGGNRANNSAIRRKYNHSWDRIHLWIIGDICIGKAFMDSHRGFRHFWGHFLIGHSLPKLARNSSFNHCRHHRTSDRKSPVSGNYNLCTGSEKFRALFRRKISSVQNWITIFCL